jgi:hypothetical protein
MERESETDREKVTESDRERQRATERERRNVRQLIQAKRNHDSSQPRRWTSKQCNELDKQPLTWTSNASLQEKIGSRKHESDGADQGRQIRERSTEFDT